MIQLLCSLLTLLSCFLFPSTLVSGGVSTHCVNLKRAPEHTSLKGGHTSECFVNAVVSFETCRQLLFHSTTCSFLSYRDMGCSLHDNTRLDFEMNDTTAFKVPFTIPIVYTKEYVLLTDESSSETCSHHGFKSALSKFRECLNSASTSSTSQFSGEGKSAFRSSQPALPLPLPLLGIVISVTGHWAHTHKAAIASITSNFECYSATHNYIFVLNVMEDMPVEQFFHARHHSVLHQHLHRFQFLLHLDADSLVLNISRSLNAFLQPTSPHVQLHMNENGEVTAATYLLRNSAQSRCFLQYWDDFSPPRASNNFLNEQNNDNDLRSSLHHTITSSSSDSTPYDDRLYEVPNYDNGDLVAAVMNLLGPGVYLQCMRVVGSLPRKVTRRFTNSYHQTVVECWKLLHSTLQAREAEWSEHNLLKIYLPKEGYWRTHSRRNRFGSNPTHWWNLQKASCFPSSDIIGHGWKGMMRKMWPQVSDEHGQFDTQHVNSTRLCAAAVATPGSGGNPRCRWLDPAEELLVARRSCSWRSPVCVQQQQKEEKEERMGEEVVGREAGACDRSTLQAHGGNEFAVATHTLPRKDFNHASRPLTSCNLCLAHKNANCATIVRHNSGGESGKEEGVSAASGKNMSLAVTERTTVIHMRDLIRRSEFSPDREQWWERQMCAACPADRPRTQGT